MVHGRSVLGRFVKMVGDWIRHPIDNFRVYFVDDWSKRTHILLYMETLDSTIRMKRSRLGYLKTRMESGAVPTAFNPMAQDIARRTARIINGKAMVMGTETLFGIPTTAHILGGACMGDSAATGVIDKNNHVFNYKNMMICDGSMISANPGVNPSLSITAITERAMSMVKGKE